MRAQPWPFTSLHYQVFSLLSSAIAPDARLTAKRPASPIPTPSSKRPRLDVQWIDPPPIGPSIVLSYCEEPPGILFPGGQGLLLSHPDGPSWLSRLLVSPTLKIGLDLHGLVCHHVQNNGGPVQSLMDAGIALWLLNPDEPEKEVTMDSLKWDKIETALHAHNLWRVWQLEMRLMPILAELEVTGIAVDLRVMTHVQTAAAAQLQRINEESPIDLASHDALAKALGIEGSVKKSVLQTIDHPLARQALEHRRLSKYRAHRWTLREGRIRGHWLQTGTATGRLACKDPNLQNIAKDLVDGVSLRHALVAPPGYTLIAADYSQIEMRLLAHFSEDATLIDFFTNGRDIHRLMAARALRKDPSQVTPAERGNIKALVYGILYGMGQDELASKLRMTIYEASRFQQDLLAAFPTIQSFMQHVKDEAWRTGDVRTLLGRRRPLDYTTPKGRRQALNTVLQGSAADLIKLAMLHIEIPNGKLVLQAHDELVYEVLTGSMREAATLIKEGMEGAHRLSVPLIADLKYGPNLGEMQSLLFQ